ncbi:hypothetical protein, partial [Klebsiella grimontii]|uniref:hypothetical protein n=1 Tax=Klebsiella grimontii TaxID=2058152 RepID=UPI001C49C33E
QKKTIFFNLLKLIRIAKPIVSGTWCGAVYASHRHVIVRQVVSSRPKRGELQKVNRERGSKCFGYQPG